MARCTFQPQAPHPRLSLVKLPDLSVGSGPVVLSPELTLPACVRAWIRREETQAEVDEVCDLIRAALRNFHSARSIEFEGARLFRRIAQQAADHRISALAFGTAERPISDTVHDQRPGAGDDQALQIDGADGAAGRVLLPNNDDARLLNLDQRINRAGQILSQGLQPGDLALDVTVTHDSVSAIRPAVGSPQPCGAASRAFCSQSQTLRPGLTALLAGETLTAAQMADQGLAPVNFTRVGDAALNVVTQAYEAVQGFPRALTSSEYARAQGFDFGLIGQRAQDEDPAVAMPVSVLFENDAEVGYRLELNLDGHDTSFRLTGTTAAPRRPIAPPRAVPAWARIADQVVYVGIGGVVLFFSLRIGLPIFQAWLALP